MSAPHLDERTLDKLMMGLPPSAEAEAHLATCAACREELEERRKAAAHFESKVLPASLPKVRARVEAPHVRPLGRVVWLVPALAAAAMALLVLRPRGPSGEELAGDLRVKGGVTLQAFARRESSVFEVHEGQKLRPGDALRFVVWPGEHSHLAIASMDGRGQVSVYFPQQGGESQAIPPGQRFELPLAIELDQALGKERVFALLSDAPLELAQVTSQLEALGTAAAQADVAPVLALPGTAQATLRFEK